MDDLNTYKYVYTAGDIIIDNGTALDIAINECSIFRNPEEVQNNLAILQILLGKDGIVIPTKHLIKAIEYGNLRVAKILLDKMDIADVNKPYQYYSSLITPLSMAFNQYSHITILTPEQRQNSLEILQILLEKDGIEFPATLINDAINSRNPLDAGLLPKLLSRIPVENLNKPDESGKTILERTFDRYIYPYDYARKQQDLSTLKALLNVPGIKVPVAMLSPEKMQEAFNLNNISELENQHTLQQNLQVISLATVIGNQIVLKDSNSKIPGGATMKSMAGTKSLTIPGDFSARIAKSKSSDLKVNQQGGTVLRDNKKSQAISDAAMEEPENEQLFISKGKLISSSGAEKIAAQERLKLSKTRDAKPNCAPGCTIS